MSRLHTTRWISDHRFEARTIRSEPMEVLYSTSEDEVHLLKWQPVGVQGTAHISPPRVKTYTQYSRTST